MNSILVSKALEKIVNPAILVNMVSQRVRQLNSGAGGRCRPLISGAEHLSAADIALHEIIEDKIGFDVPEIVKLTRVGKRHRRPQGWTNPRPE